MSRVLWVTDSGLGSFYPAVPLVRSLRARGHEVVIFSSDGVDEHALRTFRELGFDTRLERSLQGFRLEPGWYRAMALERARQVGELLAVERYDGVVVDCLSHGAGLAAERANLPWVSYTHYGIDEAAPTIDHRLRRIWHDPADPGVARSWWDTVRADLGLGPDARPDAESGWCPFSPLLTMIIGLPELALRPAVGLPTYVRRIGPVLWDPPGARIPSWVSQLGRSRPAVLVSNSTTGQDDFDLITRVVGSLRGSELEIVVTATGAGVLPDLGVRLAQFIPHSLLIPRVKAVVCSAGYGTVTKAACSGVPLVLVPRAKDQFVVAAAAELAGIAIVELPEAATPARIGAAVRRLLSEPGFADRAARLGRAAQRYSASVTAAEVIEQAIQTSRSSIFSGDREADGPPRTTSRATQMS